MVGDQLPVRRRDRGDLRPDRGVERRQPREVSVAGRLEGCMLRGRGRLKRGDDPLHVQLRVRDVHPEVRVDGPGPIGAGEVRHAGFVRAELDERARRQLRLGKERREPVVDAQSVHHDQVGAGDRADVRRRRRIGVGVGAGRDEARDPDLVPARLAHEVREDRRGRDDVEGIGGGRRRDRTAGGGRSAGSTGRARAAGGDHDHRQGDRGDADEPSGSARRLQDRVPADGAGRSITVHEGLLHGAGAGARRQSGHSPNSSKRCSSIW